MAALLIAVLLVGVESPSARGVPREKVATEAVAGEVMAVAGIAAVAGVVDRDAVAGRVPAAAGARARSGAPAIGPGPGRAWPVGGRGGLLQRFDPPPVRWAAGHRGVDLAASVGDTVRSAAPGVVSFSGSVGGRAVVTVTHPGSGNPPLRSTYLPVIGVPVGTEVAAGQSIGVLTTGVGHCAEGCLHWGLLRGKRYLDPLALLGTGRARLLPLDVK
ncbi:murein hydrolase activator EnvC family protein [Kitasatospora sp. NPDC096147]|uniref:murein hydrolase activator EnvC family protein n=1 Tax=Kitasatospora sp. NPDC096147 TaxID=3364093 RepID=UPI00382FE134